MNYREFLFVLSCLDWKEVEYTVMNDDSGAGYTANSIDEVKSQLDEVYHFDKEFKDNCDKISVQSIKMYCED